MIKSFKLFNEGVKFEEKERLLPEINEILNLQIANELISSQLYRAISCWLNDKGWVEAAKYFFKSADEELEHMRKIYQYLFDKNCKAKVPATKEIIEDYIDIKDILEKSLEHEIGVTLNWENISNLAKEKNDNSTYLFAQWFLEEQKSEEDKFRYLLNKCNLNMPDWKLDELFGTYDKK